MTTILLFQYILYFLELAAFITGLIFWKKISNTFWKWFPVYLAFIVISEQTGNYLNYLEKYSLKRDIFNYIVIPVEFLFFYWLYYKTATGKKNKQLVLLCTIVYMAGFIIDQLYFNNKKFFFTSFSYSIGNLSLLLVIISFFIQLAKSPEIIHFKYSLMFWVSFGLLIFYLGTLPYFGLFWLLYREYLGVYIWFTYLMFVCNWIMYLLFSIGFIWTKPK